MRLSKHFCERWEERVKKPVPSAEELCEIIDGAVFLQRCLNLYTARGISKRILAAYWVPDQSLILKIDEKNGTAVTVITADITDEGH